MTGGLSFFIVGQGSKDKDDSRYLQEAGKSKKWYISVRLVVTIKSLKKLQCSLLHETKQEIFYLMQETGQDVGSLKKQRQSFLSQEKQCKLRLSSGLWL